MICIVVAACGAPPFPSGFYTTCRFHLTYDWPLKSFSHSCQLCHVSWVCTPSSSRYPASSLCTFWATACENMDLPGVADTQTKCKTHALFSLFPPCSQHDLTTLFPPPKSQTAPASPAVPRLGLLCLLLSYIRALFLSSPFSYVINSHYQGPPTRLAIIL